MAKFEYRQITTDEYSDYSRKAQSLLTEISTFFSTPVKSLSYLDVINFFRLNFNLHFSFYDIDPMQIHGNTKWVRSIPKRGWIKYKDIIPEANFSILEDDIVNRVSGFTVPKGKRTLIMVNQHCSYPRLIFTILHELCHFYFHVRNESKKEVFVSLTSEKLEGNYLKEMIPFENEANNIGSMLFCSDEKLEEILLSKMNFKQIYSFVGMSAPAMHNRLLNYLEHAHHLSHQQALSYVWSFRAGNPHTVNLIKYKIRANQRKNWVRYQDDMMKLISMERDFADEYYRNPIWENRFESLDYTDNSLFSFIDDRFPF